MKLRALCPIRSQKMKEGVKIREEATIQTSKGNFLKPDLVVVNQGRVHVPT
jgi:hypothetical protein